MSDNKVDGKLDFRNVKSSQFSGSQIERAEFSELQSSKRVFSTNCILKDAYTHFIQTLNDDKYPTLVEYWQALHPSIDRLLFGADVNGNKAGTYFILQEYLTKKTHVFYYVVSGSGSAPGVGDVETAIAIETNDSASLIAFATKSVVQTLEEFYVRQPSVLSGFIEIEYYQFGETVAIDVGTTGFLTTRITEGSSTKVGEVCLDYDVDGNVIYNGNTLRGLLYNPYTASFDVERDNIVVTSVIDLGRPKSFDVSNVNIPLANTEVSLTLPENTKRFKLQSRQDNSKLTIRKDASGDYFTVRFGAVYEETDIDTNSVVLIITTSKDNTDLEVLTWL